MGRRIRGQIRRRERVGLRRLHRFGAVFRQMYNLNDSLFDVDREPSPFMRLVAPAGVRSGMAEPWPFEGQYTFGRSP